MEFPFLKLTRAARPILIQSTMLEILAIFASLVGDNLRLP